MSVQSEITRIENAKADISAAISDKGVTVPSEAKLNEMAPLIRSIQAGGAGGTGGGGGTSVETCNVNIRINWAAGTGPFITDIIYTTLENGAILSHSIKTIRDFTRYGERVGGYYEGTISCIVGSSICLLDGNTAMQPVSASDDIEIEEVDDYGMLLLAKVNGGGSITV